MNFQRVSVRIQHNNDDHEDQVQAEYDRRTVNVVKINVVCKKDQTSNDQQVNEQNSFVGYLFRSFMLQSHSFVTEPYV